LVVAGALALLVFAAYAQVRHFGFLDFDDRQLLAPGNPVREPLSPATLRQAFVAPPIVHWVPVAWVSHNLDFTIWGRDAGGHHLTSVALHAANAALLFLALAGLTGSLWPSATVAALFAVHPLRVESVAWISDRPDLLMGLFALLAVLAWAGHVRRPSPARYALTLALFGLGLLAKPQLVVLPLLLLVLDYWPLGRFRGAASPASTPPSRTWLRLGLEKTPLLLLSLAAVAVERSAIAPHLVSPEQLPLRFRAMNAVTSLLWYPAKTAWPSGLAAYYPHPRRDQSETAALAGLLLVVAVTAALLRAARRRPYLLAGWLWYLAAVGPVLGFLQYSTQARADRYAYLSQAGLLLAAVWGAAALGRPGARSRRWHALAALAAAAALVPVTVRQVGFWRSDEALFRRALAVTERNHLAHTNLGVALLRAGNLAEAEGELRAALRIAPGIALIHDDLGQVLAARERPAEAAEAFRQSLRLDPAAPGVLSRLAGALESSGRPREAAEAYAGALAADPWDGEAANGLGRCLAVLGEIAPARAAFERAVAVAPGNLAARVNLARALLLERRPAEAAAQLRAVLGRDPRNAAARELLAAVP
jgi:Flp pilus assembly protein TadD